MGILVALGSLVLLVGLVLALVSPSIGLAIAAAGGIWLAILLVTFVVALPFRAIVAVSKHLDRDD